MDKKLGVILYHADLHLIYKDRWVNKCLDSIKNQTIGGYTVYEMCYGETQTQLWEGSIYFCQKMENHIEAMNYLLDIAFGDGCDVVFNINLDDFYPTNRFSTQLRAINEGGHILCSSDFQLIYDRQDGKKNPPPIHMIYEGTDLEDDYYQKKIMSGLHIGRELENGHNIVCHPSVAYTKKFWNLFRPYDVTKLGREDMVMWKKVIEYGESIHIIPEVLCYHRISDNQTGKKYSTFS